MTTLNLLAAVFTVLGSLGVVLGAVRYVARHMVRDLGAYMLNHSDDYKALKQEVEEVHTVVKAIHKHLIRHEILNGQRR